MALAIMKILDDIAINHISTYFKLLSDPTRLKVLNILRDGERNVGNLTDIVGGSTANISKHLAMLAKQGFVTREARGTTVYYQIADPVIFDLCDLVCGHLAKQLAIHSALAARLDAHASNKK